MILLLVISIIIEIIFLVTWGFEDFEPKTIISTIVDMINSRDNFGFPEFIPTARGSFTIDARPEEEE